MHVNSMTETEREEVVFPVFGYLAAREFNTSLQHLIFIRIYSLTRVKSCGYVGLSGHSSPLYQANSVIFIFDLYVISLS